LRVRHPWRAQPVLEHGDGKGLSGSSTGFNQMAAGQGEGEWVEWSDMVIHEVARL